MCNVFAGAGELQYHGLQPAPGRPLHARWTGRGPGRCDTGVGEGREDGVEGEVVMYVRM